VDNLVWETIPSLGISSRADDCSSAVGLRLNFQVGLGVAGVGPFVGGVIAKVGLGVAGVGPFVGGVIAKVGGGVGGFAKTLSSF